MQIFKGGRDTSSGEVLKDGRALRQGVSDRPVFVECVADESRKNRERGVSLGDPRAADRVCLTTAIAHDSTTNNQFSRTHSMISMSERAHNQALELPPDLDLIPQS